MYQTAIRISILVWAIISGAAVSGATDNLPNYYELITSKDKLESGKHYLLVSSYNSKPYVAYNGYNSTQYKGNPGSISPSNHTFPITDCTNAKPIKLEQVGNTTDKWYIVDGETNLYLGAHAESNDEALSHNIISSSGKPTENDYFVWKIYDPNDLSDDIWNIKNKGKTDNSNSANAYLKYDDNNNGLFRLYNVNEQNDIIQIYKEMEEIPAPIGFTGYGTLYYSNKNLIMLSNDGVVAHTCVLNGNFLNYHINYTRYISDPNATNIIAPGTAVVITGPKSSNYYFYATQNSGTGDSDNDLKGRDSQGYTTLGNNDDETYYFYKLTTRDATEGIDNGSTGFYWGAANGAAFVIPAHKAFLAIKKSENTNNVQSFLLDYAADNIVLPEEEDTFSSDATPVIYDLLGRRLSGDSRLQKGIYIINGRKVAVR